MEDDKKTGTPAGGGMFAHLHVGRTDPNAPKLPYKTWRPKRRRKGQLNDGEWAPGYGPDAKKLE